LAWRAHCAMLEQRKTGFWLLFFSKSLPGPQEALNVICED